MDARIVRTTRVLEQSVLELAAERPIAHVTVSELCAQAGVTRRTFYNRFDSPGQILAQVLRRDLAYLAAEDGLRRARATGLSATLLRRANADIVDHVLRHRDVYRKCVGVPRCSGL